jgi:hypothetical protein
VSLNDGSKIIHRGEDGAVTLHVREFFTNSIEDNEITFRLRDIKYNIVIADGTCEDGIIGYLDWDEMDINWSFSFELEVEETPQTAIVDDDLNIELELGTIILTEVVISPFAVLFKLQGEEIRGVSPRYTIHTTEGSIIGTPNDLGLYSPVYADDIFCEDEGYLPGNLLGIHILRELPTEFLDLNTVTSIEIGWEKIMLPLR